MSIKKFKFERSRLCKFLKFSDMAFGAEKPRRILTNRVGIDSTADFKIKVIDNEKAFQLIQEAWNKLVSSNPRYTIFSTWEWAFSWWQVYSTSECELHIITIEKNGVLCAIAPFYLRRSKIMRTFETSYLFMIGTGGEEWDEVTSVYLDIIVGNDEESLTVNALVDYMAGNSTWSKIVFQDLESDSIIVTKFAHLLQLKGCLHLKHDISYTFPIALPNCYETYLSSLSKSRRKSIRQNKNRFEKTGKIEQRFLNSKEDIDRDFHIFVDLHMKKQVRAGGKSAFASDRFIKFHKQILELMVPKKWIDMRFVILDGSNVSALYNYRFKNKIYSYQSGHNYGRWSPGLLADSLAIEEACEHEIQCYDMLKGKPGTFKNSLGADQEALINMVVYSSKKIASLSLLIQKLKSTAIRFTKEFSS